MSLANDRLWQNLLSEIRTDDEDLATFLDEHASMRVEPEVREVIILGPRQVGDFLEANPEAAQVIDAACEKYGWWRYVYHWADIPAGMSPSGYEFMMLAQSGEPEEDVEPGSYDEDAYDEEVPVEEPARRNVSGSPFDAIKQVLPDGSERWWARELAKVLGYGDFRKFQDAIERARETCESSGHETSHHIAPKDHMVKIGSGSKRKVQDLLLTRFACYLIAMNGNPKKEMIAKAQVYFATQTRKQEILQELREETRRVNLRDVTAVHNQRLARAARDAGVMTPRDFGIFQDYGYMGLYDGRKIAEVRRMKRIGEKESPLDYMGFDELAANSLRISLTEQKIRREGILGRFDANDAHEAMGQLVRKTLIEAGAMMPEDMPTPEHIDQARKRLGNVSPDDDALFGGDITPESLL